jgi:hypothetical protein
MKKLMTKTAFSFCNIVGKSLFITLLLVFLNTALSAQSQFLKTYGGESNERIRMIEPTQDGGYIAAASTSSFNSGDIGPTKGGTDFWILKFDAIGAIQWQKILGGSGNDTPTDIKQTTDGGYIVVGQTNSNNTGDVGAGSGAIDLWIVKLNASGTIQWQKVFFEGSGGVSVAQTTDGGYIVAQNSSLRPPNGRVSRAEVLIMKLDATGVLQWSKLYGGTADDYVSAIQQTKDGGYIVAGYTNSNDLTGITRQSDLSDGWIFKLKANGDLDWQKVYGGALSDALASVQQTADDGYIASGSFTENLNDAWVLKINTTGVLQWEKKYGGDNYDVANSIRQTTEGGYIMAGYTNSNSSGNVGATTGGYDIWLLKLSSTGTIEKNKTFGGNRDEIALSVRPLANNNYIVGGYTDSNNNGDVGITKSADDV